MRLTDVGALSALKEVMFPGGYGGASFTKDNFDQFQRALARIAAMRLAESSYKNFYTEEGFSRISKLKKEDLATVEETFLTDLRAAKKVDDIDYAILKRLEALERKVHLNAE